MQPLIPRVGLFPTLVFDPDIEGAARIASALEARQFSTAVAWDAHDALRFVKRTHFRVVVVVADLGNEDCRRFLRSIHRATPRSWLIVASAYVDRTLQTLVYEHGGDALVGMPVDIPELAERISILQIRSRPLY